MDLLWTRQLFLVKPGTTSQQTYTLEGRRQDFYPVTGEDRVKRSSLMAFEFPDNIQDGDKNERPVDSSAKWVDYYCICQH